MRSFSVRHDPIWSDRDITLLCVCQGMTSCCECPPCKNIHTRMHGFPMLQAGKVPILIFVRQEVRGGTPRLSVFGDFVS